MFSRHISPAIVAELNERLPEVLASFATITEPAEKLINDFNTVLLFLLDSGAPVYTKISNFATCMAKILIGSFLSCMV